MLDQRVWPGRRVKRPLPSSRHPHTSARVLVLGKSPGPVPGWRSTTPTGRHFSEASEPLASEPRLVNGRRLRAGGMRAASTTVLIIAGQIALGDVERAGDRRAERHLEGDHHAPGLEGVHDPAEAAQGHRPVGVALRIAWRGPSRAACPSARWPRPSRSTRRGRATRTVEARWWRACRPAARCQRTGS